MKGYVNYPHAGDTVVTFKIDVTVNKVVLSFLEVDVQRYLVQRILSSIPVLFILAVIVFSVLRVSGGDPAAIIAGKDAPQWQIEAIRNDLGLNKPVYYQLGIYLGDLLQGDLGESINSKKP